MPAAFLTKQFFAAKAPDLYPGNGAAKPEKPDFLPKGKIYTMTYFEDGINAGRQAMDYRKKRMQVKAGDTLTIKMVRNGGWAAHIKPVR